jgi:DNA-binding protein H-NS
MHASHNFKNQRKSELAHMIALTFDKTKRIKQTVQQHNLTRRQLVQTNAGKTSSKSAGNRHIKNTKPTH